MTLGSFSTRVSTGLLLLLLVLIPASGFAERMSMLEASEEASFSVEEVAEITNFLFQTSALCNKNGNSCTDNNCASQGTADDPLSCQAIKNLVKIKPNGEKVWRTECLCAPTPPPAPEPGEGAGVVVPFP